MAGSNREPGDTSDATPSPADLRLKGRSAIVTGASLGLGAGVARALAAEGARLVLCSRSEGNLQALAHSLAASGAAPVSGSGERVVTVAADVTDPATARRLAATARDEFGGLDALVCNAGGPPPGDFAEVDDDRWEEAFRLILLSPLRLIRACLPMLRAGGSGRIVMIGSISAFRPVPRLILSNTLRPALSGLARHLASELASDGILVNAISPGFFDTERSREVHVAMGEQSGITADEVRAQIVSRIPLQRQGDPAELGRLVAFLVSDENSYITGQTLIIDGGLLTT